MAEIWGMAIAAGAGLIAAERGADAAKDAAGMQRDASNQGIAEQRAAREQFQANIDPYLQTGGKFNTVLGQLAGGDQSAFFTSPGYQFQVDQSMQALNRGAAAQGNYRSGGTDADRIAMINGLASQEYNNFFNQNLQGAQLGQNAAVGAGSMGQQSANAISGLYGQIGQAGANGVIGSANQWGNALQGLGGLAGQYFGNRGSGYQAQQTGNFGAFNPNVSGGGSGLLGPSNGSSWNFGGP